MRKRTIKRDYPLVSLNIIPLIDVMLVLLAVFMVTAPMMAIYGVRLPVVSGGQRVQVRSLVITARSSGVDFFDGKNLQSGISLDRLKAILSAYLQDKETLVLSIAADQYVSYGVVMDIFSLIHAIGFSNVRLLVQTTT